MSIKEGNKVSFDYTLTVEGEVIDASKGRGPLEYTHGQGQIIPGLSKELEGMKTGEEKTVTVAPKEGYGEINPEAFQEISKTKLPEGKEFKVGMGLQMQTAQGKVLPAKIAEVKEETVVMDLNHPLAGKELTFEVKIVSVE